MSEKLFNYANINILASVTALVGSFTSEFAVLLMGVAGWAINVTIKVSKAKQEKRHREELHQAQLRNLNNPNNE